MLSNENKGGQANSICVNSVIGFANVLAVIAAFLGTPPLHRVSVGFIRNYTTDQYGEWLAEPVSLVWFCLIAAAVFFISRATLSTALVMGGLMLASRFAF